ncbi:MAG: hypothetical protein AAGU78_07145 [Chloroflexota bacterium]|jgi:hypothetical protein|nr:hypothetical protein [Anaerolineae bacterium]HMM29157.1 hypothetical protein [Aggregatilineaceae bacterium]
MRHFQTLGTVSHDAANDTLLISDGSGDPCAPTLWFGREGMYLSVAAGYGPLEIALRPRYRDVVTSLAQLRPTSRLTVMRRVGTGQAHLELGLSTDGELLLRTAIIADATGHVAINLVLTPQARAQLFEWLEVPPAE